jgi:hypothetical protein
VTTYNALNATQKAIVRWVCSRLQLGQPALYQTGGGVQWYCFDDDKIDLTDVAILGAVAANLAALANQVNQAEGPLLRAQIRAWAVGRVVLPAQIAYTQGGNPYAETLAAQGAPATVQAADSVPASWSAVVT